MDKVYTAAQVRRLDQIAIRDFNIPGYTLMCRAGDALFASIREYYPTAKSLCVVCGAGNNAGDGYVVARLAHDADLNVSLIAVTDPAKLKGDALTAYRDYAASGGHYTRFNDDLTELPDTDVIVDALLGIGLTHTVEGSFAIAIHLINKHHAPVIAVDVPSGLNADTGQVAGIAVQAAHTLTFIAHKQGLFTGQARDYCGKLQRDTLNVPAEVYQRIDNNVRITTQQYFARLLPPRDRCSHKGSHGHAVLVGGNAGMSGAIRLAGEGALRAGSGLVTVATHQAHADWVNLQRPELMVLSLDEPNSPHSQRSITALRTLLQKAKAIGIGPGLGKSSWSRNLLTQVLTQDCPKVLDADALNLLAQTPLRRDDWILTPHPAEAARLLVCSVGDIEQDRFAAARELQQRYGGIVVLKGAGTLIASADEIAICTAGNPGMASGGMGDVLTGIICGLLAQDLSLQQAAEAGVFAHATAADHAAQDGERGLIASDVLAHLRTIVNPWVG